MTPDEKQPTPQPEPAYEPPAAEDLETPEGTAVTASGKSLPQDTTTLGN